MNPSCTPVVASRAAKNCSCPASSTTTLVSNEASASARQARAYPAFEHLDRDVLDAAAVALEVPGHRGRCLGADEHDRHATGVERGDAGDVAAGEVGAVEPERAGERSDRRGEIVDRDDEVIDARGDRVEARPDAVRGGQLVGRSIRAMAGHLDAVGLGEQHSEELLGEVGVDAGIDRELASRRHHVAHAEFGWITAAPVPRLTSATSSHTASRAATTLDELAVEFVDAITEPCQAGEVGARTVGHGADVNDTAGPRADPVPHAVGIDRPRRCCVVRSAA